MFHFFRALATMTWSCTTITWSVWSSLCQLSWPTDNETAPRRLHLQQRPQQQKRQQPPRPSPPPTPWPWPLPLLLLRPLLRGRRSAPALRSARPARWPRSCCDLAPVRGGRPQQTDSSDFLSVSGELFPFCRIACELKRNHLWILP